MLKTYKRSTYRIEVCNPTPYPTIPPYLYEINIPIIYMKFTLDYDHDIMTNGIKILQSYNFH